MSKPEILAVHRKKLEEFLEKLGLLESLSKGKLKCRLCGATITLDNLGFIIPSGNEIFLCCTRAECVYKLKELQRGELKSETGKTDSS